MNKDKVKRTIVNEVKRTLTFLKEMPEKPDSNFFLEEEIINNVKLKLTANDLNSNPSGIKSKTRDKFFNELRNVIKVDIEDNGDKSKFVASISSDKMLDKILDLYHYPLLF
jgi:hypothetical protein